MQDGGNRPADYEQGKATGRKSITLRGLLAVWVTIAVLAGLTVSFFSPTHCSYDHKFGVAVTRNLVQVLELAIEVFKLDNEHYPWPRESSGQLKSADIVRELMPNDPRITAGRSPIYNKRMESYLASIKDRMIKDGTLVDTWGNEFRFKWDAAAERPLIYSFGPNGTDEGAADYSDDVSNL